MAVRVQGNELQPFQQFITEYCATYETMDVEKLSGFFSRDDIHCFGTGIDERLTNRESLLYGLQRDFSELESVTLTLASDLFVLKISETVASLSTDLNVSYALKSSPDAVARMPKLRLSMVLEQQDGKWTIVDVHISAPLDTQVEGRSFPEA